MVRFRTICNILEKRDNWKSWDTSESDRPPAAIGDLIDNTLVAFERSHQTFSKRYRVWVHNGEVGRWPDKPGDNPDDDAGEEIITWDEAKARSQWKNGIEQIRDLLSGTFDISPLFEIITNDQQLRGDIKHKTRGETLILFLSEWAKSYAPLMIQKADLEKIFNADLGVCSNRKNAREVIGRLEERGVIIRKEKHERKRHGVGVRSKASVYYIPNPHMVTKLQGPVAAYQIMSRLPAVVEIAAALQLERDAALETLKDHGLLEEYEQRCSLAGFYRTPTISDYWDDEDTDAAPSHEGPTS